MRNLSFLDIKQALWDSRFRDLFPEHVTEINEFMNNPGCACNVGLYRKLMGYKDRMQQYFPTRTVITSQEEVENLAKNTWNVINCAITELEKELKKLKTGRKQVALTRWQDQITAVVNGLVGDDINHWKVINSSVNDLDSKLKSLSKGRKQIALARWQEQVTVVINELQYSW